MTRLLAGKPEITDGALTKRNLYIEARVSRATMNRATAIMREWEASVAVALELDPESKRPLSEERKLQRKIREKNAQISELAKKLEAAATLIALLTEDNRYLRHRLSSSGAADIADMQERRARPPATHG